MTYSYDPRKIETGGDVLLDMKVNGQPVEDNKMYSVATNNFVTGQFLKFFGDISENISFKDTGAIDRDIIIDAVENQKVINSVEEKRIADVSEEK